MLLQLAQEIGLNPKRTSATQGGEFHSPCPNCGGNDRFFIQPNRKMKNCIGYYKCRQCEKNGDTIQFCIDFMGLTFPQACERVGHTPPSTEFHPHFQPQSFFTPRSTTIPSQEWQKRATDFALSAHECALRCHEAINTLKERGFTLETIKKCQLGWNALKRFDAPNLWGIGRDDSKDIWLPRGIVIPTFFDGHVMKLKIRRTDIDPSERNKYIIVPGGRNSPSFFGATPYRPIFIIESELDAILMQQFAGDLCAYMAIPAGNKPDKWALSILNDAPGFIFAMDFDEAGKKTFAFWKTIYPQIKAWPVPQGKSPGDAYKLGVNLREWVIAGIA